MYRKGREKKSKCCLFKCIFSILNVLKFCIKHFKWHVYIYLVTSTSLFFSHCYDGNHPMVQQQYCMCYVKVQQLTQQMKKCLCICMINENVFSLCVLLLVFLRSDMKQVKVQSHRNSHALQLPYQEFLLKEFTHSCALNLSDLKNTFIVKIRHCCQARVCVCVC